MSLKPIRHIMIIDEEEAPRGRWEDRHDAISRDYRSPYGASQQEEEAPSACGSMYHACSPMYHFAKARRRREEFATACVSDVPT